MAMTCLDNRKNDCFILSTIEELVPQDHQVRTLENAIDWNFIYPLRKETIERVYADCKEKHCLRYTRVKGLKRNQHESLIIFSCHNLEKVGRMKVWKRIHTPTNEQQIKEKIREISKITKNIKEKVINLFRSTTLSTI